MTATPHGARIHVVSARTSNNPYASINLYCTKVKTREHAQFVGIISFALFICLTVVSFFMFEADAIFYIVFGIFIYAFLTESLFRIPRPCGVLLYLVFETLQIGFYIATIIFLLVELTFSPYYSGDCYTSSTTFTSTTTTTTTSTTPATTTPTKQKFFEEKPPATTTTATSYALDSTISDCQYYTTWEVLVYLILFMILMAIKIYFIKVFTQYYKFISFQENHSNELRAQYVNGRGVNIRFPDPAYDNPVVNDPGYSYNLFPRTTPLPELPTYHQAMTTTKSSSHPDTPTTVIAPPEYPLDSTVILPSSSPTIQHPPPPPPQHPSSHEIV